MKNWLSATLLTASVTLVACGSTKEAPKAPGLAATPSKSPSLIAPKRVRIAPEYRTDAPNRYIVQRGDTLWRIASRFLKNPARWKEIWHANPQLKNPNRLYPGDIISYKMVGGAKKLQIAGTTNKAHGRNTGKKTSDGRPVYNLTPTVRTTVMEDPIPTLPKDVVYPFMTKNLVLEPDFAEDFPYIVSADSDNRISLTQRGDIYALGDDFEDELYDVFRQTSPIADPENGELLGVEATYVGKLKMTAEPNEDGVATFAQTNNAQPMHANDVLIPAKRFAEGADLHFFPRISNIDEDIFIIKAMGQSGTQAASQFSTLLINLGGDDGIKEGDVFNIVRKGEQTAVSREGMPVELPNKELGVAIVYKTHDQTSYALVMNATGLIYPGDRLVAP